MSNEKKLSNVILMLCAVGWTQADIIELMKLIRSSSAVDIERYVRRMASTHDRALSRLERSQSVYEYVDMGTRSVTGIGKKVQSLLREQAGLTNEEAVSAIKKHLSVVDKTQYKLIPKYSKSSLASWVDRVAEIYSPSQILHVATIIRNDRVRGETLDWTLRKYEP